MWAPTVLLLAVFSITSAHILPTKWSVQAIGRLLCNGNPVEGMVELIDKDNAFDDLLDTDNTTSNGKYYVRGSDTEWSKIEPYLVITYQCNSAEIQRTNIVIPQDFVYKKNDSKQTPVYIKDHELSDQTTTKIRQGSTSPKPVEASTYLTAQDVLPKQIKLRRKGNREDIVRNAVVRHF